MKRTKKGFTLVELLVVIAILAILASVSVVGYTAFIEKADKSVAEQELHQVVTYINAELIDDGEWTFSKSVTAEGGAVTVTTYTLKDGVVTATQKVGDAAATTISADIDAMIKASGEFAGIDGTFSIADGKLVLRVSDKLTVSEALTF